MFSVLFVLLGVFVCKNSDRDMLDNTSLMDGENYTNANFVSAKQGEDNDDDDTEEEKMGTDQDFV